MINDYFWFVINTSVDCIESFVVHSSMDLLSAFCQLRTNEKYSEILSSGPRLRNNIGILVILGPVTANIPSSLLFVFFPVCSIKPSQTWIESFKRIWLQPIQQRSHHVHTRYSTNLYSARMAWIFAEFCSRLQKGSLPLFRWTTFYYLMGSGIPCTVENIGFLW